MDYCVTLPLFGSLLSSLNAFLNDLLFGASKLRTCPQDCPVKAEEE
ncbi:unnamed protein product [Camellia sinensis]